MVTDDGRCQEADCANETGTIRRKLRAILRSSSPMLRAFYAFDGFMTKSRGSGTTVSSYLLHYHTVAELWISFARRLAFHIVPAL